ncbi:MAG: outer membrane beta-barrel protein [Bacteroidetes bacterium]|nr:outer membrane beta-barrel protein [Bacteroidota bacterium]
MRTRALFLSLVVLTLVFPGYGQSSSLKGKLYDDKVMPLASGTVVLLNPADSTMEFFGITNGLGEFEIRNIKAGSYLLQASFIGFRAFYSPLAIPRAEGPDVGDIVMQPLPLHLVGAEVVGEAVPLQIIGDTVVYNASAFRTRPDAMTEDLLRKLPGVEVDRAGNIKALGEDVETLYVDGKEFFGSDPTVATRNIPADAIDRVKVYDKKSDDAEFTGIDDGTRQKTVNLELKEDTKRGVFGDVLGGYGTGNRYKAGAKVYRFTDRVQMAGLGMLNNVNEYGFSFSDYLDFKGGISAMSGGHGSARINLGAGNSLPVNFGQPVDGLVTSGAGGLNFSYSTSKHNRTYISYLVDGSDKAMEQSTYTERFTDQGSFTTTDESDRSTRDMAHRINFGLRRRLDSIHNFILSGDVGVMYNHMEDITETRNMEGEDLVNNLLSNKAEKSDRLSGNLKGSYFRILGKNRSVFKASAAGGYSRGMEGIRINNQKLYPTDPGAEEVSQFQDNRSDLINLSTVLSYTQRISKGFYVVPTFSLGGTREHLDRVHGLPGSRMEPTDSISPAFDKVYRWMRPGISLKWNSEKSQLSAGVRTEIGLMETSLDGHPYPDSEILYLLPSLSWDYSPKSGRKINLNYASSVGTPTVSQLLPVANTLNPLTIFRGNPELTPEFSHNVSSHWLIFDQFSFTSLMMSLSGGYTRNKINWSSTVTENLVQINTLTNVDWDYRARFNLDFSTPIRKLGIKINLDAEESWNRGISLVNGVPNNYNTMIQNYSFSADNRKKRRWDVESGIGVTLTNTSYDIQESLNSRYFDISWFTDIDYTPSERWNILFTADFTTYSDLGFDESIQVPLLRSEVSFYFLAHYRGVLTLKVHDLLDRNQNVQRLSELNYLRESRSNTIGRYVMLTFKYRLNKFAREGGLKVDVSGRR